MHLAIKKLFQPDERKVLIAGVAKLILDCCFEDILVLVDFASFILLPNLFIRSIRTSPKQMIGVNIFVNSAQDYTRRPSNMNLYTLKLVSVPLK